MKFKDICSFLEQYRISVLGISLGLLFCSASMTPSLIPRSAVIQGTLGGVVMAMGYLFAIILIRIWRFLELPELTNALRRAVTMAVFLICLMIFVLATINLRGSQNELRVLMTMKPLESSHEIAVVGVGFALFFVLFLVGRLAQF